MSVYEAVRVCKEKGNRLAEKININKMLRHICCMGLGVLFSLSGFNENFSPFGVAFVSAVSGSYTITATIGACLGYFIGLDSVNALRYTASALAAAVIVRSLKAFRSIGKKFYIPLLVSFASVFVTGMAVQLSGGFTLFSLIVCCCEAITAGAVAFVFYRTKNHLSVKGGLSASTSKEITSIIISGSILLLSLKYAVVFNISLANIIAVFLVLLCSYYGKASGGAIVGVCCGVTLGFGTSDIFTMAFYSMGGLLSGAMSSIGRVSSVVSFCLSGIAVGIISGYDGRIYAPVAECLIGSVLFFLISYRFSDQLEAFFHPQITSPIIESVKNNVINKLYRASEFSSEICQTLDCVNEALSKSDKADINIIPEKARNIVCSGCGLSDNCWGEGADNTKKCFSDLLELKKQGNYLDYKNTPTDFTSFCIKSGSVCEAYNKIFSECKLNEKNENRIKEIQSLASEQFTNVSGLLLSLCDEIEDTISHDVDIARQCKVCAISSGLNVIDSCCVVDGSERIRIELRVKLPVDIKRLKGLVSQLEGVAGRSLFLAYTDEYTDYVKAVFDEKPKYNIVTGSEQYNANDQKYCGDSFSIFTDDNGIFYAVICDGMGTGVTAAVSSALAVNLTEKLIKGGFGIESVVSTVNTSLISKSGDECSVTFDLVAIDLYSGRAEFYKCGAQSSVVKHHGKVSDIMAEALPMGIISNIKPAKCVVNLSSGDAVVLCSDGLRDEDFWQLRNALKVFDEGSVQAFTTELSESIRHAQPKKNDDFTMLTLVVSKN